MDRRTELAERWGIEPGYFDVHGRRWEADEATIARIAEALSADGKSPVSLERPGLEPNPAFQGYLYAGREQQSRTLYQYSATGVGPYWYGLGIPTLTNSGCYTLNGTCAGQNQTVDEITGGFWWKFYRGALGNAQFGVQLGRIDRKLFTAVGGSPEASMFEGMASFRIYPYQK